MKKKFQRVGISLLTIFIFSCNNSEKEVPAKKDLASITKTEVKPKINVFNDFIYDVGPRFGSITKSEVVNATTIDAFLSEKELKKIQSITSVSIIPFRNEKRIEHFETGNSMELTAGQLHFLKNAEYSTSFVVQVNYQQRNESTGTLEDNYASPHLTIVPEKQASFLDGKDALKAYLKLSTEEVRKDVDPEKLQPAKLYFTVTKMGTIENIHLDRPSGYPEVDKKMKELISQVPGTWLPAENAKGEKVDQELVVSFGLIGC